MFIMLCRGTPRKIPKRFQPISNPLAQAFGMPRWTSTSGKDLFAAWDIQIIGTSNLLLRLGIRVSKTKKGLSAIMEILAPDLDDVDPCSNQMEVPAHMVAWVHRQIGRLAKRQNEGID